MMISVWKMRSSTGAASLERSTCPLRLWVGSTSSGGPELVREVNGESGVQYLLSRTEISIDLKAYTDYDVAGFTADFVRSLEGQVQIESMSISRNEPITSESIQRVATDASTGSFTGTLRLSWNNARTVTPDEEDQP